MCDLHKTLLDVQQQGFLRDIKPEMVFLNFGDVFQTSLEFWRRGIMPMLNHSRCEKMKTSRERQLYAARCLGRPASRSTRCLCTMRSTIFVFGRIGTFGGGQQPAEMASRPNARSLAHAVAIFQLYRLQRSTRDEPLLHTQENQGTRIVCRVCQGAFLPLQNGMRPKIYLKHQVAPHNNFGVSLSCVFIVFILLTRSKNCLQKVIQMPCAAANRERCLSRALAQPH